MIQILLVDDHPSVGEGTKTLIEKETDMTVTVVYSAAEALHKIEERKFDVLLVDLNMPAISGLELTRRVMTIDSDAIVLIYTGFDIAPHFNILIESGVSGFISKAATREQIALSIRSALRGDAILPVHLLKQLRRSEAISTTAFEGDVQGEASINEREQLILQEAANGLNNREIAGALFLSQRTVEYHMSRIFDKLKVRSRSEAIKEGRRLGLIRDSEFIS